MSLGGIEMPKKSGELKWSQEDDEDEIFLDEKQPISKSHKKSANWNFDAR